MENQQTITGNEAIRRARNLKYVPGAVFTLIHLTCDFKKRRFGETVKHEHCRVRAALKEDSFQKDGIISKSGSDVYYNCLIYIASLTLDEYFVLKEINRAIHLNFPEAKKQGIRLGFWIDIPSKMQDTTPSDRIQQTATADPQAS